ncbi:glycosyltransferase [Lysinibacillus irui]|uniref:Glycosyltransferase n=1 Tax=Lysinibacillus irui TaxID=2998077 RepID=A0AAJ5RP16_9BACI|nr:glycosyltransferase [Lysinibacillus irui]WDV07469.1 glycosyltransferase [Lysinibacillus irui]
MKVSIITPVYNAEKYIDNSIESVLNQTYQDFELIIVNDGSTDNSAQNIKKYLFDSRIKYYLQENKGESAARNKGIEEAQGEFIAFLDADDLYQPTKIEEQINYFNQYKDIDVVYTDVQIIDEKGRNQGVLKSEEIISTQDNFLANMLYRQLIPGPAAIMLRRKCIESGIRYPENYSNAEDYLFTIQLSQHFNFGYLPKKLYSYRRHDSNLTNNHSKQLESECEIIQSLGVHKIISIVKSTSYNSEEQNLLLAKIFLKINELQKALEFLDNNSENWEYFFVKGIIFYKLNRFTDAKAAFELGRIKKENAEILNNLGCTYCQLGNWKEAVFLFKKAINIRENYSDPLINLASAKTRKSPKITEKKLRVQLTNYNK